MADSRTVGASRSLVDAPDEAEAAVVAEADRPTWAVRYQLKPMATAGGLLRSSRDGDQFQHHWGARQAPKLVRPGTALTAIAIDGP